jgi:hypothetical protein
VFASGYFPRCSDKFYNHMQDGLSNKDSEKIKAQKRKGTTV